MVTKFVNVQKDWHLLDVIFHWNAYHPKLLKVIYHVAYLLSPDPVVQNHSEDHNISQDSNAMESLIKVAHPR